jgi:UPF0755 protein
MSDEKGIPSDASEQDAQNKPLELEQSSLSAQEPSKSKRGKQRVSLKSPRQALEPEVAPEPPAALLRVRNPFVVAANAVVSFLFLLVIAGGIGLYYGKVQFDTPGPLTTEKVVNIPKGQGTSEIANVLKNEGIITQPLVFQAAATLLKVSSDLKAGEYEFKQAMSMREIMEMLVEGKSILHSVTIPEGLTSEQALQRLRENETLSGDITISPKEGSLLPDTYKFQRGTTRNQLITRMMQESSRVTAEVWARRSKDSPIKSLEEMVILASIVEKETGRADERSRVAAVFINRLNKRMRLQSDPTIIYGLVGGKGTLGRPISRADIESQTPYNTYVIDALPPTPIANPGRASLEAVANPSRTNDLYFVASGQGGGHVFSETYEQHQKHVVRLRELERKTANDKQAPEQDEQNVQTYAPSDRNPFQPLTNETTGSGVKDPLQDKTFDLQTPKTVPSIKP